MRATGIRTLAAALAALLVCVSADAQEIRFFRIGTGSISGVYFPIAGLIASAISNPPGSRPCERGGSCGVPGLIAVAQATEGSVANVRGIADGRLDSALVQSDIAYFAQGGRGMFRGRDHVPELRAIANLYPEAVHVVVRRDSGIESVADLKGRRVSVDLAGSGTRTAARLVLARFGVPLDSIRQVNSQIGPAVDRLRSGDIDAFFFVGGFPVESVVQLAQAAPVALLPVAGAPASEIRASDPFFHEVRIPAGTYPGVGAVDTIGVGALWVVSARVAEDTVYGMTRALWHPSTRKLLRQGHPVARQVRPENALKGIAIPLHPGAVRYYQEVGLIGAHRPPRRPPRSR